MIDHITLVDQTIDLVYSHKRRKHISLQLVNGRWQLRLPAHLPDQTIQEWLTRHHDWLINKLHQHHPANNRRWAAGSLMPYRGQQYPLKYNWGNPPNLGLTNRAWQVYLPAKLPPTMQARMLKQLFANWYLLRAKRLFPPLIQQLTQQLHLPCPQIKYKLMYTRWGSCNHQAARLNLDWRLLMAPDPIWQYVAIHEVCHLRHPNHQPAFWRLVQQLMPEYHTARHWLKTQSAMLQW